MMSQDMLRSVSLPGARVAGWQASRSSSFVRSSLFVCRPDLPTVSVELLTVERPTPELQRFGEQRVGYISPKHIEEELRQRFQAIGPSYICANVEIGTLARQAPVLIVRTVVRNRVVHLMIQEPSLCHRLLLAL